MAAKEALDAANEAAPGERLHRCETICGPRGGCRREACTNDPSRWTWCQDCLTLYDDYGKAVNRMIPEAPDDGQSADARVAGPAKRCSQATPGYIILALLIQ